MRIDDWAAWACYAAVFFSLGALALLGEVSAYREVSPARAALEPAGSRVAVEGTVRSITPKSGGSTVRICQADSCLTVYAPERAGGNWSASDPVYSLGRVRAGGEMTDIRGAVFMTADYIYAQGS